MHAARADRSARLRRVLEVLLDGREHSTRDLVVAAEVCAVNSIVAELRANGYRILCRQGVDGHGVRRWWYRLRRPSQGSLWDLPEGAR